MFQFSGFTSSKGYYVFNIVGCPIRKSADHFKCADPRSLSQLITSFFVSESLGIPHTLLLTFSYSLLPKIIKNKFLMSSVMFYSYNMSKNFLLVNSTFTHPNGSPAFHSSTSSNVVNVI